MSYNLHLHLSNNDKIYGFQPVKLVLREEISQISTGELLVYSPCDIDDDKLKYILDAKAALVIEGNSTFRRCYTGIVTSAKQLGLVANNVYAYELIIAAPIVKLKYSTRSRFFQKMSLKELIRVLGLAQCGYDSITFPASDNAFFISQRNFYQNNESDFAFFSRVLMFYGLNWISFSPFPVEGNNNEKLKSVLHICSTGNLKSVSSIQSPQGDPVINVFTCTGNLLNVNLMQNWHFRKRIGSNGLRCASQTGLKTIFSQQGKMDKTGIVNTGMFTNLKKEELNRLTANCLHAAWTKYTTHHAQTKAFSAMPGNKIILKPFNADEKKARVYASCLVATSATTISEVESKNSLQIDFSAVEENADNLFANPVYTPKKTKDYPNGKILQAVVCGVDNQNNPIYKGNDINQPIALTDKYTFYAFSIPELAKIEAGNKKPTLKDRIEVHLLQSLGGNKQGLFRIPRVGDRVLLYSVGTEHFLLSWLPDKDEMPIVEHDGTTDSYNKNEMTVFRHISANNNNSELDFFSSQNVKKENDRTLLRSGGELHLQAKKVQSIFSSKVHIGTASEKDKITQHNGMIHIYDADKITFDFEKSLTMKVQKHSITMDKSGIRLSSSIVTDNSGPLKAELSLNGLRGILGSGIRCHFHGTTECSVSEGSGAGVTLESSAISVGAAQISLQSLQKIPTAITVAGTLGQAASQYINMGIDDKAGGIPHAAFSNAPVILSSIFGIINASKASCQFKGIDIAQQVILLVENILFAIYDIGTLINSSWWDEENSHGISRRDQFGIAIHAYVMAAYTTISIFFAIRAAKGESNLYLLGSHIAKETKSEDNVNQKQENIQNILPGEKGEIIPKAEPKAEPENK